MSLFDIIMALLSDIGGLFSSLTKIITLFLFYLRRPTIVQAFNSNMFMVKSEEHKHEDGKVQNLVRRTSTKKLPEEPTLGTLLESDGKTYKG